MRLATKRFAELVKYARAAIIPLVGVAAVLLLASQVSVVVAMVFGALGILFAIAVEQRAKHQAVAEVAASADRWFRSVLDSSPDFIFVFSGDAELSYVSPSVERVTDVENLNNLEDVLAFVIEDHRELARALFSKPETAIGVMTTSMVLRGVPTTVELRLSDERDNAAVGGLVVYARDVTAEHKLRSKLKKQARSDELTKLPNRRALNEAATAAFARSERSGNEVALVLLDLDGFKGINDTLGHPFGDQLLAEVANRLQAETRGGEMVGRIGGDEFGVIIEGSPDLDFASAAQRFIECVSLPHSIGTQLLSIGCSAGVARSSTCADIDEMFRQADIALYESKRTGRGVVSVFDPGMEELLVVEARLTQEILSGITNREFSCVYQPLVSLEGNVVVGFEALLRWDSAALGPVAPDTFIPIAERSGAILKLGAWVLDEACTRLAEWTEASERKLTMSVNVSPAQLYDEGFVHMVQAALDSSGIAPDQLVLEITESAMMENVVGISEKLNMLRTTGIRVAIDDFGTGYSSLGKLHELPVDCIKIDRTFVTNSTKSEHGDSLLSAILDLGKSMNVDMIAEGVETGAELSKFTQSPQPLIQGFFFARPVAGEDIPKYLESGAFDELMDHTTP